MGNPAEKTTIAPGMNMFRQKHTSTQDFFSFIFPSAALRISSRSPPVKADGPLWRFCGFFAPCLPAQNL
jgi:hypothetical protein